MFHIFTLLLSIDTNYKAKIAVALQHELGRVPKARRNRPGVLVDPGNV
jgi:hypothetical protein